MKVLITGVTGQVGALAAKRYLDGGHQVVGLYRRSSSNWRLKELGAEPIMESGDLTDSASMFDVINKHRPSLIFNTAAASHVGESFRTPNIALEVTGGGVLNLLESVRKIAEYKPIIVQCSSSEMFGSNFSYVNQDGLLVHSSLNEMEFVPENAYQDETTPLSANSPYAAAKIYAHNICDLYRRCYDMNIITPIFFNMESKLRTDDFVTRKITDYIGRTMNQPNPEKLFLGNLEAQRDWSHVEDSLNAVDLMVKKRAFESFVVCSEQTKTIKDFCKVAFSIVGKNYLDFVKVSPDFYRPCEVPFLKGNSKKLRGLGWQQSYTFDMLVDNMVISDINRYESTR
jgi:GDPmannose 4,6-dehydratase